MDNPPDIAAADDRLRRMVDVLRRQNDPGMHEAADGIAAYRAGRVPTLEDALGLRPGPGQRSAPTRAIMAERDQWIRQAAADHFPGPSTSRQARQLHTAIDRYAASSWRHDKESTRCPRRLTGTINAVVWEILSLDGRVLCFERIRKILVMSSVYS